MYVPLMENGCFAISPYVQLLGVY